MKIATYLKQQGHYGLIDLGIIQKMVEKGGKVPLNALCFATRSSDAVNDYLLAHGADVNANFDGQGSPLGRSITRNYFEGFVVNDQLLRRIIYLLKHGANPLTMTDPLFWLLQLGPSELIPQALQLILAAGVDPNARSHESTLFGSILQPLSAGFPCVKMFL